MEKRVDCKQSFSSNPDKKLAAVCGLFCPTCSLFIGTIEDETRLQTISKRFQFPPEELKGHGCRSEKRGLYCRKYCKITKCAAEKGIDFCGECPEYPCNDLKTFQGQMPHRIELWESQERIKKVGYNKWYAEMITLLMSQLWNDKFSLRYGMSEMRDDSQL
jgi:hypothetical protein